MTLYFFKRLIFLLCLPFLFSCFISGESSKSLEALSPDGRMSIKFTIDKGVPYYSIFRLGKPVIKPSRLGFTFQYAPPLAGNFAVESETKNSMDETWSQPWGEKKDIRNHYNELRLNLVETTGLGRKMTVVFRVFDDGVGFRYEIPEQPNIAQFEIMDELTEFALAGDHIAWWIKAFQWNRYEYLYQTTPVSQIDTVHTPLTLETDDGLYLSIHEAALTDFASMTLARTDSLVLKSELMPWSDGVKVRAATPVKTPWRTIQIADNPGGLITSYLILNLNEPNRLKDVSWIKPGKYVGIWWEMHLDKSTWGSGPRHGATTANAKRYIDFAARYGFDGVLVEGWNVGWDGDWIKNGDEFRFTTCHSDFDINQVTRYAAEKGVRLIGHHETGGGVLNYESQLEDAFSFYENLGVRVVKTGYVNYDRGIKRVDENGDVQGEWHHGQFMVRHYRKVVETAAAHHIMLDVHEPVKDTGIRRTYPNMMTREGARGQEYNAWSSDGGNPPDYETIIPFTRLLAGPMDFTPGIFDLLYEKERPNNRVNTTLAKQLALYVVIYSPLQMAADLPQNYEANPEPFEFIQDVPVDWQNTQVLHAKIGDYVTIVRQDRNSDDWYLGSITDEKGRVLEAPLTFLEAGKKYAAEIYRDGEKADWQSNPYSIVIEKKTVDCGSTLMLRLAPGGGQAIRFTPVRELD